MKRKTIQDCSNEPCNPNANSLFACTFIIIAKSLYKCERIHFFKDVAYKGIFKLVLTFYEVRWFIDFRWLDIFTPSVLLG